MPETQLVIEQATGTAAKSASKSGVKTNKTATDKGKKRKKKVKPEDIRSGGCGSKSKSRIRKIKQHVRSRAKNHKVRYYIDSRASNSILFNQDVLEEIEELQNVAYYSGNNINVSDISSLKKGL